MKRFLGVLLSVSMIFSLVGCVNMAAPEEAVSTSTQGTDGMERDVKPGDDTIKIGLLFPYSGSGEQMGKRGSMGAQFYAEHYFPEMVGGFKNKDNLRVELVYGDTQTSADVAVSEFERLVSVEKVDAVVGTFNSAAAAACAPLAIKYGIPFQVVGASSDAVCNTENGYVFRAGCTDQTENKNYVQMINRLSEETEGGIHTIAMVYTAEDYGTSAANGFRTEFTDAGYDIIVDESIELGSADVSGIIQRVKNADPDLLVVMLLVDEAIVFFRQYREYGCQVPILAKANGVMDPSFTEAVGKEAEYTISGDIMAYDSLEYLSEMDKSYVDDMIDQFGLKPNETAAMGWLAMGCLLQSIDNAESLSHPDIAKAMAELELENTHPANLLTQYPGGVKYGNFGGIYNQNIHSDIVPMEQLIHGHWTWIGPSDIPGVENKLVWPVPQYVD